MSNNQIANVSFRKLGTTELSLRDACIHWVLTKLFDYRDIVKTDDAQHLYLRRYFITKKKPETDTRWFIHFIARSDNDRHLHDHPWAFTTRLLLGSYVEETFIFEPGDPTINTFYKRGSVLHNKATHAHRLHLNNGPVWSLVKRMGRQRLWGFWVDGVHVPWDQYLGVNEEFDADFEKVEPVKETP